MVSMVDASDQQLSGATEPREDVADMASASPLSPDSDIHGGMSDA
eukprot:CAMPEP_0179099522 /NCGR_PEP_ID=MMETSP0796-20121207/45916_1 /TAXON_ID=73915 /ORGANISM="Pyrodinium bahamense, Strain pbaha01" /LENGTH=44 /DNA_ID= /DNA_START= /DNA_END= /DNA_ORIENTATION=